MNKRRLQELAGINPTPMQLAGLITKAIDSIDNNLSYKDFAAAVAHVLIRDYGKHNYAPFINSLSENLKNNLEDILNIENINELKIQKKNLIGSGEQQNVYAYLKNPNFVLKTFINRSYKYNETSGELEQIISYDNNISERNINYFIDISHKYPKYIAKTFRPNKNSKYYIQEKVDVESSQDDINKACIYIINKMVPDLKKKFSSPEEAYDFIGKNSGVELTNLLFREEWDDISNISNIDDYFEATYYDSGVMGFLFDEYVYKYYSKKIPILRKLFPVYKIGINYARFGDFHEGNLGYDKDRNFKIIDL